MTRKYDKGDQPSGGETTWTYSGATRWQRTAQYIEYGMLRPSPNHGTLRLPNDDDDDDDDDFPLGCHCIFVPNTSLKLR